MAGHWNDRYSAAIQNREFRHGAAGFSAPLDSNCDHAWPFPHPAAPEPWRTRQLRRVPPAVVSAAEPISRNFLRVNESLLFSFPLPSLPYVPLRFSRLQTKTV